MMIMMSRRIMVVGSFDTIGMAVDVVCIDIDAVVVVDVRSLII